MSRRPQCKGVLQTLSGRPLAIAVYEVRAEVGRVRITADIEDLTPIDLLGRPDDRLQLRGEDGRTYALVCERLDLLNRTLTLRGPTT